MKAKKKVTQTGASAKGIQWGLSIVVMVLVIIGCFVLYLIAERNADTVSVVMWKNNNYKNGVVTSSDVVEYKMQRGEFENYAIDSKTGNSTRRLILWDDVNLIYGTYCTRNVYAGTLIMTDDLMYSRIDNSDMIMYNFPGREIVALDILGQDLNSYKSFLEPGDTINVTMLLTETREIEQFTDEETQNMTTAQYQQQSKDNRVDVTVTEPLFDNIYIADMLNQDGESVLDLYTYYKTLSIGQQTALDNDESWKERTTASTILVALTKEELLRYFLYKNDNNVTFMISLPQR